jgi:hypothetical protein
MQIHSFIISVFLTHRFLFTPCSVSIIIYYGIPMGRMYNHALIHNVTMPPNWEITKLYRREGEESTKTHLRVPCKLKTSALPSDDS